MGGRGVAIGGGAGGLVALILALLFGGDVLGGTAPVTSGGAPPAEGSLEACDEGADLDANPECRFVFYVNSVQGFWEDEFARRGGQYQQADTIVFSGGVQTACGGASSSAGPFYCPADQQVYLDLGFFTELQTRFGGSGGDFAEAYVLAHEYGHHVQNLTGQMQQVQRGDTGPESTGVRLELQADCYAGVWTRSATQVPDASGQPLITELDESDIREGLEAAQLVGDDYIQERFQGSVTPETWTHGSSEQRQRWFLTGLQQGTLESCDTFSAQEL
jgi:predicted metalloprotease